MALPLCGSLNLDSELVFESPPNLAWHDFPLRSWAHVIIVVRAVDLRTVDAILLELESQPSVRVAP